MQSEKKERERQTRESAKERESKKYQSVEDDRPIKPAKLPTAPNVKESRRGEPTKTAADHRVDLFSSKAVIIYKARWTPLCTGIPSQPKLVQQK